MMITDFVSFIYKLLGIIFFSLNFSDLSQVLCHIHIFNDVFWFESDLFVNQGKVIKLETCVQCRNVVAS